MKSANVFQMEMASLLASRRVLLLKLIVPFLIGFPFLFVAMPVSIRTRGLALIIVFSTLMGAAVSNSRRRSSGMLEQLRLLPLPGREVIFDTLLADFLVDLFQTGTLLGTFLVVHHGPGAPAALATLWTSLCLSLGLLNLTGLALGRAVRSSAEVHLTGALGVGIIALASGLLPAPSPLRPLIEPLARWSPLGTLARALEWAAATAGPVSSPQTTVAALLLVLLLAVTLRRGFRSSR